MDPESIAYSADDVLAWEFVLVGLWKSRPWWWRARRRIALKVGVDWRLPVLGYAIDVNRNRHGSALLEIIAGDYEYKVRPRQFYPW